MVNKIKAFINIDGKIVEIDDKNIIEAYKASDGEIFLSELDAYKHEVNYLSNVKGKQIIVNPQEAFDKIEAINGAFIPKNVKQYSLSDLFANSCELVSETPGIYMWINVYEKLPYCGSASNLKERVKSFVNSKNDFYAGKKINEIRKKYVNIHNLAWRLFILEENVEPNKLLEKEDFYINKFDSINHGYNSMKPIGIKKEDCEKKYQIELRKQGYTSFLKRVKEWGLTTKITLEEYSCKYIINEKYPSFRLNCFINNKKTVEYNDLISVPKRFVSLIDVGRFGFRNENDKIPSSLIRYRAYDNAYIPLCNTGISFKNAIDAAKYQIENYREKALNALTDEENKKYYDILQKCSIEQFIELMFHDFEKTKTFINGNSIEENISINFKSKEIKRYYYETISNIESFGLKVSENLTLENYINLFLYESQYRYNSYPFPSFRMASYLKNKNTIDIKDFVHLPYGICKHIDTLKKWNFITTVKNEKIPDFMKYRPDSKQYTVIGLAGLWYDTPREAIIKYLNKILNDFKKLINDEPDTITYDDKLVELINSMDYDILIDLIFENPEEIKKIIKS